MGQTKWLCNVRGAVVIVRDEGRTSSLGPIGGSAPATPKQPLPSNHFGAMVPNVPGDPIVATNGVRCTVVRAPLWRASRRHVGNGSPAEGFRLSIFRLTSETRPVDQIVRTFGLCQFRTHAPQQKSSSRLPHHTFVFLSIIPRPARAPVQSAAHAPAWPCRRISRRLGRRSASRAPR